MTAFAGAGAVATVVIAARCTACGVCLPTCPEHALRRAPKRPRVVDERCTACMACVEVCPVDAITVVPPPPSPSPIPFSAPSVPGGGTGGAEKDWQGGPS